MRVGNAGGERSIENGPSVLYVKTGPRLADIDGSGCHWSFLVRPARGDASGQGPSSGSAVRDRCRQHGLELLGINTPLGEKQGDFGLAALPGREEEFRASFDAALRYAEESGAAAIHVMAGLTHGADRAECEDTFRRNLDYAARATDRTLLLEPINQRDKPGYFYSTLPDVTRLAADVSAQHVKIMFDVYHLAISERDITKKLEKYLPIIGHIQIAAVPSRAEPNEGEIDYSHILSTIDGLDYHGWVGCEYLPRGGTDAGLGWIERYGGASRIS